MRSTRSRRDVRQSATSVGYSAAGRFWGVELPLAGPVLLSGLRVVVVSTVSLATVGAVIGVQSLGSLFTDGFQRGIQAEIITGIVATIALALAARLGVRAGRSRCSCRGRVRGTRTSSAPPTSP